MRRFIFPLIGLAILSGCASVKNDCVEKSEVCSTAKLSLDQHFMFDADRDLKWKTDIYDKIEGNTIEEKGYNALTTLEMKAISEIELWNLEDQMVSEAKKAYDYLTDEEKLLLLESHDTWKNYVSAQANLLAGGGSAGPLYARSIIMSEIRIRTQLYKELGEGYSSAKTGFSIYEDK